MPSRRALAAGSGEPGAVCGEEFSALFPERVAATRAAHEMLSHYYVNDFWGLAGDFIR
jgi:hypothetical protein